MLNNEETIVKDLQVVIAKNRKILDTVYIDTENLKRDKTSLENEILRISKHVKYQEEILANKDKEIAIKSETILGIDSQITDKSKRRDELEGQISAFEVQYKQKKDEYDEMETKLIRHSVYIKDSLADVDSKHLVADEKAKAVEYKIAKIEKLLTDLK